MKLLSPLVIKGLLASTGLLAGSAAFSMPMSNDIQKHDFVSARHFYQAAIFADAPPKAGESVAISFANAGHFNNADVANAIAVFFNGISKEWTSLASTLSPHNTLPSATSSTTPSTKDASPPAFETVNAARPATPVPEPMTLALLGLGLAGIGFSTRARQNDKK